MGAPTEPVQCSLSWASQMPLPMIVTLLFTLVSSQRSGVEHKAAGDSSPAAEAKFTT